MRRLHPIAGEEPEPEALDPEKGGHGSLLLLLSLPSGFFFPY
jgi:hypothetical protein